MTLDEYEKNKFLAGDKIVNSDIFVLIAERI